MPLVEVRFLRQRGLVHVRTPLGRADLHAKHVPLLGAAA